MNINELLKNYKYAEAKKLPNYILIPVTVLKPNSENAKHFNKILNYCQNEIKRKIVRTPSRGISISMKNFEIPSYDYTISAAGAELIILLETGYYRIQFRSIEMKDNNSVIISGRKAFLKFQDILKKFKIDLSSYAINNGEEVNKQTEKYMINSNETYTNCTIKHCNHIDFHSSFPAGLINTHPEFKEVLEYIYSKRHDDPIYKKILNYSIGYMHSKLVGYKYSQLSRDAINDNNKRIRDLAERLEKSGAIILLYNTDGIWYTGEVYHGEGEGKNIGDWENDHIDCTLRYRSRGAYEFMENGTYTPVVRGRTTYDNEVPRSEWKWGDIYKGADILYYATENGIVEKEGN